MKQVEIKSIDRKTLSKQVIDEIIQLLTTGQLKPGDRLPSEMELMTMFNVSRPVMREALTSLEAVGVVHRKTRNGTFFSDKIGSKPFSMMLALSTGNVRTIIETRISLELGLVTMAAEKISDDSLKKLEIAIEEMKKHTDDYRSFDRQFHEEIAQSASNPLLEAIIDPLLNLFDETWDQIPGHYRNPEKTLQHHIDIYNALKNRDPIAAYTSMYTHLNYVRERVYKREREKEKERSDHSSR
ncbi:FadR/GntR family transcriptional regulator [Alteribacillus sp. HJP-4]|uniref:FadR/GntR family transcriptional regulator n=1 Tax=Alteribacillus sp. HJP-4 TaxID=2775394 RepID=UPI0035CCECE2